MKTLLVVHSNKRGFSMKKTCVTITVIMVLFFVFSIVPNIALSEEALWKIKGAGKMEGGRALLFIEDTTRSVSLVLVPTKKQSQSLIKYFGVKDVLSLIGKKYFPGKNSEKDPEVIKLITKNIIEEKKIGEMEQNFDPPPYKRI